MSEIQTDIEEAKKRYSCNIKLIDNSILASFNIQDESGHYESGYVSYDKIFTDWQDFVDYCNIFFAEQLGQEMESENESE